MKDWYTEKKSLKIHFGSILEYEYLYLNGELDIDCIYLEKEMEHLEVLTKWRIWKPCFRWMQTFSRISKDKNIKIRDCSAGRRGMRYGMLIPRAEQKDLLILNQIRECSWICKDVLRERYNLPENRVDRFRQI